MGLDIYVGSVTRYTLSEWDNVIVQHYKQRGEPCVVVRENVSEDALTDAKDVLPAVLEWRESLSSRLQNSGLPPLD